MNFGLFLQIILTKTQITIITQNDIIITRENVA